MKNFIVLFMACVFTLSAQAQDCLTKLEQAFNQRGSNFVTDNMHNNVYLAYIEDGISRCVSGKAKVENQKVVSVFLQYEDGSFELMDAKFYNAQKRQPVIANGVSELIYTTDGEKFKIVFIDSLKSK